MDNTITNCKQRATEAVDYFLHTLSFVPADKLTWSPTPTAKSALRIAAHCAGYSVGFVRIIRAGGFLFTVDEFRGPILADIESITTLEEAEAMLRRGTAEMLAALDALKPEQVAAIVDSPIGPRPFTWFMDLPAGHLDGHAAQIDYLQTCWDDQEVHL